MDTFLSVIGVQFNLLSFELLFSYLGEGSFVIMSDSDDDDNDDDDKSNDSDNDSDDDIKADKQITEKESKEELLRIKAEEDMRVKKERLIEFKKNRIANLNPRNLMKNIFKKKVDQKAKEFYCKQEHIQTADLNIKLEIGKNCRLLVELLTDKKKRKSIKMAIKKQLEREAQEEMYEQRRLLYQQQADADEEEMDENYTDQTVAMTGTIVYLNENMNVIICQI
jgi:hypothetical protein